MGMQGIRAHDPPFDIQGLEKLLHARLLTLFLFHHLFFEHDARACLIQTHLMHLLLIRSLVLLGASQGFAIQGHMLLFPWRTVRGTQAREEGHQHLVHLLGVHRS